MSNKEEKMVKEQPPISEELKEGLDMRLLPKEQIELTIMADGQIVASLFEREGFRYWQRIDPSNLPNDLISLDDLKRFGIELVNGKAAVKKEEVNRA